MVLSATPLLQVEAVKGTTRSLLGVDWGLEVYVFLFLFLDSKRREGKSRDRSCEESIWVS